MIACRLAGNPQQTFHSCLAGRQPVPSTIANVQCPLYVLHSTLMCLLLSVFAPGVYISMVDLLQREGEERVRVKKRELDLSTLYDGKWSF